ncbi:hypothetical protein C8F04DRAFT_1351594 [Mycena alexandri]|uniref:Uncharacterized protein n=1 Tax=Mycena alexandri TaxID=1745969 RepID=A0AAD6TE97_9AGAR|nr:hypothetical protein C8F04DRAFT_1351594 [Mycena alexandri]
MVKDPSSHTPSPKHSRGAPPCVSPTNFTEFDRLKLLVPFIQTAKVRAKHAIILSCAIDAPDAPPHISRALDALGTEAEGQRYGHWLQAVDGDVAHGDGDGKDRNRYENEVTEVEGAEPGDLIISAGPRERIVRGPASPRMPNLARIGRGRRDLRKELLLGVFQRAKEFADVQVLKSKGKAADESGELRLSETLHQASLKVEVKRVVMGDACSVVQIALHTGASPPLGLRLVKAAQHGFFMVGVHGSSGLIQVEANPFPKWTMQPAATFRGRGAFL